MIHFFLQYHRANIQKPSTTKNSSLCFSMLMHSLTWWPFKSKSNHDCRWFYFKMFFFYMPEEVQLYSFSQYCNRMRSSDFFPLLYSIIDLIFPWLPRYILEGPCTKVVLSLILCTSLSCLEENVNERNQSLCHLVGVKTCRLMGITVEHL